MHGEAERTDMVEFFGQQLEGFAFTSNGWVQVKSSLTHDGSVEVSTNLAV